MGSRHKRWSLDASVSADYHRAMVGRTIGKYRIVEQIGRGGMGTVYKAIDETLDRRVAIKLLNADHIDQDAVERFRREAMTLAKLNHGRIGAIHELTRDDHDLLMVMEFLEGETFEKLIERGPMPVPRAVALCAQVLDALQYAHAAGVVHRDLKPANVMLTPSGDIKVMDFGIARVQGSEHLTTNGYMVGTPAYMAPEQVRGEEVDPRMDLYAIAVVLYRMVTQRLPFHGDTAIAMIHSQLNNPPTPPQQFRADLPGWLVGVIERGLAKKPADRFQTAAEFRTALENGLTGKMPIVQSAASYDPDETIGPMLTPPAARIPSAAPTSTMSSAGSSVAPSPVTSSAVTARAVTPAPLPVPAPPRSEATVTLRAPHLATAGILLTLLVVGVGVLGFIALRRPTTTIVTPPSIEAPSSPTPAADASAAPAASAAPPPEAASAPTSVATPSTTPAAAAASAPTPAAPVVAVPSTAPRSPAPSSATSASPPTGAGRSSGARSGTPSASASASSAAPTPAGGAAAPVAAPGGAGAAVAAPVAPAAASAPAENFGDVRTLVVDGTRSREVEALLSLEPGTLVVRSRADGSVLRTMPYSSIAAATYARSRRPRGQAVPGAVEVPENVGGAGFLGGARHWLTLQTPTEFLIIRLEDRNMIRVLNGIEARTGSKVVRNVGD